ncbi:NAD(P)-binding domain-containing protein [Pendulispora albinea]|uniref:NAD(P)-binding domain-containing protein n=1 Tax=Pendulispora albinea TaxID=2741071 RepID=A0ABZ2M4S3_9BACT
MDYVVIGAGPAGLQLGYFLERAKRDFVILEAGEGPGTFFQTYPRHRTLISINKKYTGSDDAELNLRNDWNSLLSDRADLLFTQYTDRYFPAAPDLVRYLGDFAARTNLPIRYGTRVVRVERDGEGFRVTDQAGQTYRARGVIVATGVSKPYIPPIPGIETADCYDAVSVDPREFIDKRVLILGKGNSAFETADNLVPTAAVIHVAGPSSVKLAWRTHFVGHLRAVNNNFLDTYQLKSQNAVLDGHVQRIVRDESGYRVTVTFSRANELAKEIRYDRVIVCTGFRLDTSIFAPECLPTLVHKDRFPAQTSAYESVNVPGLYFAGTLMQVRDFKKSTSGFIHGFRYGVRSLFRILEQRYFGAAWPALELAADPAALADAVLGRVNRSSALWQQFTFMGDLITVDESARARYREELPVDYVRDEFGREASAFVVTLEYGPDHDKVDPFDIDVVRVAQDDSERAFDARYLHPVVRHYRHGKLAATHHVAENLENDWTAEAAHRRPLRTFFEKCLHAANEDALPKPGAASASAPA